MKTKAECESVLGKQLAFNVESELREKGINQETTLRVLDYLALHKQTFPYIEILEIARRMCDNLTCSICYNGIRDSFKELFKQKRYGYATGERVVLNVKPIRFVLPKKLFEVMLDALIRHELDHIATTKYKRLTREEYKKHLYIQRERFSEAFDAVPQNLRDDSAIHERVAQEFSVTQIRNGKKEFKEKDFTVVRESGVNGECKDVNLRRPIGSNAFNEGITAYKMKKLDKVAGQGGVMCQSGYILHENVASHFADVIGEERLIKLQTQGDFCGIVEEYKARTGKSGKDIQKMFTLLENKTQKSAFSKLFSQIRYGLTNQMDKNTKQKLKEITSETPSSMEL